MDIRSLRVTALITTLAIACGCLGAPSLHGAPVEEPPPPQNLLGSTDELQLVTELALELAAKYGGANVLVALDIDNTLLAMEQDLGSDQWFQWQRELASTKPCSELRVSDLLAVQGAMFHASAMRPTQPDAAKQIRRMQGAGIKVIALTARDPDYRLQTFRELRRHGMSFWTSAWPPERGFAGPFTPQGASAAVHYEDGVFLVAGQDKGRMLRALLNRSDSEKPLLIIAVDNKQKNLNAIMQAFEFSRIKVHAWRYTREDAKVEELDPAAADAHWNALKPALLRVQEILGPDNYELPETTSREGCPEG